jgi:hypothetical protein
MPNPLFYFNGMCVMSLNALYLCAEVGDLMTLCGGAAALALAKMLVPTRWPSFGVGLAPAKVIVTELRYVFRYVLWRVCTLIFRTLW